MSKIPATVITGFLGAGKTTLIRHLLENAGGRRIALIINEFGDLGVDGDLTEGCGIEGCEVGDVIELANGCICCTVADDFVPTMESLIERDNPPDHIVIETSGLALPKPLVKAFNWPEVRSRVTVDGVVAVIDSAAVADNRFADNPDTVGTPEHDNPLEEIFADQLLAADLVILNKTDVVDEVAMARVRDVVAGDLRPGVKTIDAVNAAVDINVLLGQRAAAEDDVDNRRSHLDDEDGHDHDDFESFTVDLVDVTDPDGLHETLATLTTDHDILRIKGFVHVPGKDMRHVVQGVGPRIQRYYDRPWGPDEDRNGRLVVIGQTGLDKDAITQALVG
ncbi:MAG: cobalamin biosynthesis protein CobW [Rhodospirillaceae bacterium]|nr:cobalamin biosynthesis protein CobW [Rhodospirillaceae bacterium]MBT4219524.1 cobalamin biosynthesis protein CobW [Rhodospirillaceae bacterium]MBT4464286.1 cobalamin biosynthesis protein CobW [Rhodospirillaceae bacterium]MBT5309625.1 cobalamin biosynthesis protein CobW [Rhodospirillaceae bacterium]MBT6406166.1 cobalamin biosynthesis protein CobW [Rhodospirillaceae bacterium]